MVDEPVVDQNDLVVDEYDISTIANPCVPLSRSQRTRRLAIPDDYEVYLQKHDFNISDDSDTITYEETISSSHSNFLLDSLEDEMKSIASNGVWDLVEQIVARLLCSSGSLRLKEALMIKWRGTRLDLFQRV